MSDDQCNKPSGIGQKIVDWLAPEGMDYCSTLAASNQPKPPPSQDEQLHTLVKEISSPFTDKTAGTMNFLGNTVGALISAISPHGSMEKNMDYWADNFTNSDQEDVESGLLLHVEERMAKLTLDGLSETDAKQKVIDELSAVNDAVQQWATAKPEGTTLYNYDARQEGVTIPSGVPRGVSFNLK